MSRRCWAACLRVLALFVANPSYASSNCSYRQYHDSCESEAATVQPLANAVRSLSLLQVSQVRSKTALLDESHDDDEPQSFAGPMSMQDQTLARHKTLALAQMRSRALQAAQAGLTSVQLMLRHVAVHGAMGPWGWAAFLTLTFGLVLAAILMSLGRIKDLERHEFRRERGSIWLPEVDEQRPSAKFPPRVSIRTAQHASLFRGGASPPGSTRWLGGSHCASLPGSTRRLGDSHCASQMLGDVAGSSSVQPSKIPRDVSEQSLVPTESYDITTFARSSQSAKVNDPMPVQRSKLDTRTCLCPSLLVPPGCECVLRVPRRTGGEKSFDITELSGDALIRIAFQKQGGQQWILLATAGYGEVLAQCGPAPGIPGEFHLLRAHGEYFARLAPSSARGAYSVWTASGAQVTFRVAGRTVDVTDAWGRLLAMTEPETGGRTSLPGSETCVLRVAPLMDVSIVICGLLIINHLM